jgi:UDP-glucose 4-epimerase
VRVLVLGGCGFIGSHVVDKLVSRGASVRVLDRRPEAFRAPILSVDYVFGDFSDTMLLSEALMGVDAVLHLVSSTVPSTSNLDPMADISGNLVSTVGLLAIMRQLDVRKIVFLSSGGTVYGIPKSDFISEDHPLDPVSSYGIVKVAIEKYLHMDHYLNGLNYSILRVSNPYGPRQGHGGVQGVIGTFLWKLARGENIEIWGDGKIVRDFIHVDDIAELCVSAMQSDRSGVFNAGYGQGSSILDVVEAIFQITNLDVQPQFKPGRNFDVPRAVLDIRKAQAILGWTPQIPLQAGISQTWEWVKKQA